MVANSYQPINLSTYQPIRFGTDGWRGIIAEDFTFDNVKIVAQALADYLIHHSSLIIHNSIVVGYDTRFLSEKFAEVFARVLMGNDIKVKLTSGIVSTPLLSFTVKNYRFDWGVMFSASHNPAKYDGIKFRSSQGGPVTVEITRKVEKNLGKNPPRFSSEELQKINTRENYFNYLRQRIDFKLLRKLKATIVGDPLFGCACGYLEEILKNTGITVSTLHNFRDPLFGRLQPEQVESNLIELKVKTKKEKALLGLAFDGDADRLGVVTEEGNYLTPHQVFPLLLYYLAKEKGLKGKVVQTVSLGYLSKRIAQNFGLPFEEVPVGFKYISEKMLKEDVLIGGEESGGYGFGKFTTLTRSKGGFTPHLCPAPLQKVRDAGLPERDGILSGLLFLEMLAFTREKPSRILKDLEKKFGHSFFQREDLRLPNPVDKGDFVRKATNLVGNRIQGKKIKEILTLDGMKIIFSDDSWLLFRPSGTEPLFRIYAETDSLVRTKKLLAFAKKLVYNITNI